MCDNQRFAGETTAQSNFQQRVCPEMTKNQNFAPAQEPIIKLKAPSVHFMTTNKLNLPRYSVRAELSPLDDLPYP
jgi:hypothetical protein